MSGPRNRRRWARSQALRAEIREMLAQHPPLLPPLTAKDIRARLTLRPLPSVRAVQWHMAAIRLEAQLAYVSRNSSPAQPQLG